jgi:hypothetical protein
MEESPYRGIVGGHGRFTRSSDGLDTLRRVEVDARPEPPEPVRRALVAALEAVRPQPPSAWWRAGVEDDPYAVARPRSSAGAERA